MAFDITSVLKANDSGKDQIVYLDLDLLDPDPENFYSLDGLDDLAGNIELIGLQQPLRVRPGENGHYIIISGHRRRAACMMIRDGGSDQFKDGVPCIVEYGEASAAMRELRLIYANAATRMMSAADLSKQAERVEALLYELKEQGVEFPGRMRDHVAEACKVSKSKLARLHAIRSNLDSGLLKYFDKGELPEETAYQLSRLPANIQAAAAERLANGKQKRLPIANVVEKVNKNLDRYLAEMPCRSHAGDPDCHHKEEKILKSIFSPYDWQVCDPGQCCRDCYHGKDCSRACQECKDRWKLEKDVEKEKEAERKKREEADQQIYRQQRKNQAKRLLPLIDAAGLGDDDELPGQYAWNRGVKAKTIRDAAAGKFGDQHFYTSSWEIIPTGASPLKAWADLLGCSVDFLLGRTDTPTPAKVSGSDTGWQTGDPTQLGEYVVRIGVPTTESHGSTMTAIQTWSGENWTDSRGVPLRLNVYRWVKLPEV